MKTVLPLALHLMLVPLLTYVVSTVNGIVVRLLSSKMSDALSCCKVPVAIQNSAGVASTESRAVRITDNHLSMI